VSNTGLAPPPLMQPVRARLFSRRKLAEGGKPPKPPGGKTGLTPPGKPNVPCDKCHVATATHEITVDVSLRLYLFMCGHHVRQMWREFVSRGYVIRKL
jgi:hypothetical protein